MVDESVADRRAVGAGFAWSPSRSIRS